MSEQIPNLRADPPRDELLEKVVQEIAGNERKILDDFIEEFMKERGI